MLQVGKTVSFGKTISESDVYSFARIIGHFNSININPIKEGKNVFGVRIIFGFLCGGNFHCDWYILASSGYYLQKPNYNF